MCGAGQYTHCRRSPFSSTAFADHFLVPISFRFVISISWLDMGKKEEEEIIRIAKKMDKMAQKKNGVRCLRWEKCLADWARVYLRLSLALTGCDGVSCEMLVEPLTVQN